MSKDRKNRKGEKGRESYWGNKINWVEKKNNSSKASIMII